jgi:hypothetical protein
MLNTQVTQLNYDDMYEALIAAHRGLSTEESHAMNARLVLLLANHIGDLEVLKNAFTLARGNFAPQADHAAQQAITPVAPVHSKY